MKIRNLKMYIKLYALIVSFKFSEYNHGQS